MGFGILGALPQRIYGVLTNEVLLAVPLFVFMGVMLERAGIAEDLLETMGRLFGPLRGGLGISFRSWRPALKPRAVLVIVPGFNSHSGYYSWVAGQCVAAGLAVCRRPARARQIRRRAVLRRGL